MSADKIVDKLISLRRSLHQHPELSGKEKRTSERIVDFIQQYSPDKVIKELGGHGILAVYIGEKEGPTVLFRCELDALPITENNTIPYKSENDGIGHLCGHDGHMAMVAGLAYHLNNSRPKRGRVLLLFQPSEENGQGAQRILQDEKFKAFTPDFVFAIHNLPGFEMNKVILSSNNFASASRGMAVKLKGKSSHAAEPENGINPALGVANFIMQLNKLINTHSIFKDFVLITPIHIRLGNIAYGTSPGEAEVHFTLRSYLNEDMDLLISRVKNILNGVASEENLQIEFSFEEIFPATVNNAKCTQVIDLSRQNLGMDAIYLKQAFRWSEDFGHFTNKFKGAIFGLGSGIKQPALHNPDFNFPDELIPAGLKLYKAIYENILDN